MAGLLLWALVLGATGCSTTSVEVLPVLPGVESRFVDDPVFGGRVHVYEAGEADAPPVVLIHGIEDRGAQPWQGVIEDLAADYRVIALDLPGFGHSTRGSHLYSPDRYAEVLHHVIGTVTDEPVHLVGHSLGGAVALRFAARHPDSVGHLYLVSVAGILHKASYTGFLARLGQAGGNVEQDQADSFLDRIGGRLLRKMFVKLGDGFRVASTERRRNLFLSGDPALIAAVSLVETDFSATLAETTVPTSVFWGDDDTVAPLRTGRLLAATLPGRDLTVFPGIGHVPMAQAEQRFLAALRRRLDGVPPDADRWPPPAPRPGEREGTCRGEDDVTLRGRFDTITIRNCGGVVLDRVTARHIEIHGSRVTLIEPRIVGDEVGLRASGSAVTLTAGEIRARTAIAINRTFLDAAGTSIVGDDAAIAARPGGASELTFSVTPLESDGERRYLHGIRAFHPGDSL